MEARGRGRGNAWGEGGDGGSSRRCRAVDQRRRSLSSRVYRPRHRLQGDSGSAPSIARQIPDDLRRRCGVGRDVRLSQCVSGRDAHGRHAVRRRRSCAARGNRRVDIRHRGSDDRLAWAGRRSRDDHRHAHSPGDVIRLLLVSRAGGRAALSNGQRLTSTSVEDPTRKSWVESANDADSDFPIQNLPFGVFSLDGEPESGRVGIAIGDMILDVTAALEAGLVADDAKVAALGCDSPRLNEVMSLGRDEARVLRAAVADLLDANTQRGARAIKARERILVAGENAVLHLPADIGDYSDFYASIHHATNVGRMFRPDAPLLPNYKYIPIGYHGRASSIVPTGSVIQRPSGQTRDDPSSPPTFGPTRRLDYELEVGALIGRGNHLGHPIPIDAAEAHVFGLCLVNDWSARDIQTWEYQPLGPFLSKSFATTVSPWVVTLDALEPFRRPAFGRAISSRAEPSPVARRNRGAASSSARGGARNR